MKNENLKFKIENCKFGVLPLGRDKIFKKPKLLIHICCACCGVYVLELLKDKYDLSAYFYNPNIQPEEEYKKRLESVQRLCSDLKIPLIQGNYENKKWFEMIRGYENEPEGGKRCEICFKMRLEEVGKLAQKEKFTYFASTLTVGPRKRAELINTLGRQIGQKYGIIFYEADFKKKDGFKKSLKLSKDWGFYRQNYCGCIYS